MTEPWYKGRVIQLLSPLPLRELTLENRLVVAPMCQYSAVDGLADDYQLAHLGRIALGSFGMVTVEAAAVTPEGRISSVGRKLARGSEENLYSTNFCHPPQRMAD